MATKVQIVNRAAAMIGESLITSIDENSKVAEYARALWDGVRDGELAAHPWTFALRRAKAATLSDAPAFGYDYAYALPEKALRVIDLPDLDRRQWTIGSTGPAGSEIKTILVNYNNGDELNVIYLALVDEVGQWPPTFCDAMAAKLAMELCEAITQSDGKLQVCAARYDEAIRRARVTDAIEIPPVQQPVDDWITARL